MSKKRYDQLEIIEDPAGGQKRKRRRKIGPVYIPWRWVVASFVIGGVVFAVLLALLLPRPDDFLPYLPTQAVLPTQTPSAISPVSTAVISTPAPIPTITGDGEFLRDIVWSGGRLAAAGSASLRVYDSAEVPAQPRWMKDYGEAANRVFNSIALSPDGAQVAGIVTYSYPEGYVGSEIAVWDAQSGSLLREFPAHNGGNGSSAYGGDVKAIAYSPDSTRMVTGAGDGQLIVWDTATGEQRAILPTGGSGTWALAFQPGSAYLTTFIWHDQTRAALQTWDIDRQQKTAEIALNGHNVWQIALSPDSAYMALREWDETDQFFISIWDVKNSRQVGVFPLDDAFLIEEFALMDKFLALSGRWARQFDSATGDMDEAHSELQVIRWSADSEFEFEIVGSKQDYLSQAEIRHLHFDRDTSGSARLHYLIGPTSSALQRWNIASDTTESIRFW